ncbi:alpha/beta fold hydrolase [Aquidulcibacter sp.]|uniref:alpha/beta fold hydrolase n=1 Tax=Aquidulcibacter sp. TaxID=2052990 RepID=UPI0025BEA4D4|nr:alpha/beta fold hydrolase [Aquidulcibacter sp.]MCA3694724.1 alpha/beta fold hydrolase [Aquidulcibacter sp.]
MLSETLDEVVFVEANGQRLETLIAGKGGTKLAVLLHGFPESNHSWRFQIPLLVKLGYEVWAPNLRGYGQSSKPPHMRDYAIEHLMEDVAQLMDQASNGRPVTLIAHDWGAIIAWAFAASNLRPLERLVILNVPHPARLAEGLRTWRQIRKSWYVFFFQLPWLPEKLMAAAGAQAIGRAFSALAMDQTNFGPDILQIYRDNALIPGALTAMVNYYRAAAQTKGLANFTRDKVTTISVPTLMIWGEEDLALGVELTDGYEELVEDFTLIRLKGVGHWVQQEAPQAVNQHLEAWLVR